MFKHGKCISQEIWIKPRKQNKTDAITTQVTRRGEKARNEQKKEKREWLKGSEIRGLVGGRLEPHCCLTIRAAERKREQVWG